MLIGVDPGYTTGICIADPIDWRGGNFEVAAVAAVEWHDRLTYFLGVFAAHRSKIEAIVIERFTLFDNPRTIRAQIGSEIPSARVIGVVECAAEVYGLSKRIVFQEPYQRNNVKTVPAHRDAVGLIKHNQDAYKHVLYYFRTEMVARYVR